MLQNGILNGNNDLLKNFLSTRNKNEKIVENFKKELDSFNWISKFVNDGLLAEKDLDFLNQIGVNYNLTRQSEEKSNEKKSLKSNEKER